MGFEETTGMVSNTLKMSQKDVVAALKHLKSAHGDDSSYLDLRKDLPKSWPI